MTPMGTPPLDVTVPESDLMAEARRKLWRVAALFGLGALAAMAMEQQMTDDKHRALFMALALAFGVGAAVLGFAARRGSRGEPDRRARRSRKR